MIALHPYVFEIFLATPILVRIVAASLLIAPIGFFLGMPFPLGILAIEGQPTGAVAWAWGLNGLFTVVGGLLSVLLSLLVGFSGTLLLALMIYGLAFLVFPKVRSAGAGV